MPVRILLTLAATLAGLALVPPTGASAQGYSAEVVQRTLVSAGKLTQEQIDDANCCPSSFRRTRYTWNGSTFKAGHAMRLEKAPARFYRP